MKESKDPYTEFPQTRSLVNYLIKPRDTCIYLDTMYYNHIMNIHGCVRTFKHQLQTDTWSYYTLHLRMDVYDIQSLSMKSTLIFHGLPPRVTRPPNVKNVGFLGLPLQSCLVW